MKNTHKTIYVVKLPDGHFVANETLSFGEEGLDHIVFTRDIADAYSCTDLNKPFPNDLLWAVQQINENAEFEKIVYVLQRSENIILDRSVIIEYAPDLYLKNNVAINIHLDEPTIILELTPNINEAHHYSALEQKICREYYSLLFCNAKFLLIKSLDLTGGLM